MPRALISDVRSLANADSQIFPFLAPRAFAVPPFRTSTSRRNAGTYSKSQREKERGSVPQTVNTLYSSKKDGSYEHGDASSIIPSCVGTNRGNSPSLRYTQAARNRYPSPRLSTSKLWDIDCRYSDIYCYGRAQCAAYSTDASATPAHSSRLALSDTTESHDEVSDQAQVKQILREKISPVPAHHSYSNGHLRRKALESERTRLQNFVSRLPFWQTKVMRHGRYRSLSRRIYALCRSKPTDILLMQGSISGENLLIRAFAALDLKVHKPWQDMCYPITLKHDPQTLKMASKISDAVLDEKPGAWIDRERMMLNWKALSKPVRDAGWNFVLLYFLEKRPALALAFIQVLAEESVTTAVRLETLADAIGYIARSSIHRNHIGFDDVKDLLVPTFFQAFSNHLARYPMMCSQDLLWSLARLSSQTDLKRIFNLLVEHNAYMGYDTILHFANLFGEFGDHEYALRCMRKVVDSISSPRAAQELIKRKRFMWSCALILRRSTNKGQNYHATTEIVADLLKLGVKLDILLYNIIMHNAMEAGDHATAFRVFNVLEENGLNPNKHTYSILLHGCTTSNNPGKFHDFAEHCKRKAIELKDSWLAAEYLYYVYVLHHEDDPAHLSDQLGESYAEVFSITSVAPFYPSVSRTSLDQGMPKSQPEVGAGQMEPPPLAVYLILQTEIRKALAISNKHVWDLYLHFRRLVDEGSYPAISILAQSPIMWNAFLLAFCMNQQFSNASYLIKSMTDSPDSRIPQPNVYSWNIFMQAFFKNEQTRAAERIYKIMRARGVEPDQFTYGVMLRGYARAQHSEKVGEVMGNMNNEEQLDPSVLEVLTKVHDRKRLMFALEQSRLRKEKEEKKKIEALEGKERKRWELLKLNSTLSS